MPGKTASHNNVIPRGSGVEEIAYFRQQVLEIAVHRQHPLTSRRAVAIRQCAAHPIGWATHDKLHYGILAAQDP